MAYALAILQVEDFAKWKAGYDSEGGVPLRKNSGMKSYQVFRTNDDPNKIVHLSQWDSMDDAQKFLQSDELQKANQQSGVIEMGGVYFLEEVEKKTV